MKIQPPRLSPTRPTPTFVEQSVSPLRYLAVAGLMIVILGAVALTSLYRSSMIEQWSSLARSHSINLAQALGVSMVADVARLSARDVWGVPPGVDRKLMLDAERLERIRQQVIDAKVTLPLLKVVLYNSVGQVLFSTATDEIGTNNRDNPRFQIAVAGKVFSDFTDRKQFVYFDMLQTSDAAFATYVPLRVGGDGQIGVIEIYQDMAPLLALVADEEQRVLVWIVAILIGFYLLILLAGRRLGRMLNRQHAVVQAEIAERREVENHLRQAQNDMEKTIAERTRRLRESESRFRDFAETASDWMWETDSALRFTFMTDGARRTLGVDLSFIIGQSRQDMAADDLTSSKAWALHQDDLLNRRPFRDFRYVIGLPDGGSRYISVSGMPIIDEHGIFRGYRGTGADVTQEREAEQQITRLGRILDQSISQLFIFDAGTLRFQQVNQGARLSLGYSERDLEAMTPFSIVTSMDARGAAEDDLKQRLADARDGAGEQLAFETALRRKDGSIYPVEMRLQYAPQEKPPAFVAVAQDISDRKRAEQALEESEGRFRSIAELSLDAIIVHADGIIMHGNGQAVKLAASRTPSDLIGRRILDFVCVEDISAIKARLHEMERTGQATERTEVRLRRLDGSELIAELSSSPITFGGRAAVQTMLRDVSQQKAVQAQLIQTAKLATLGEMAAGMAHELSQPMNVIRMAAEGALLEPSEAAGASDGIKKALGIIGSQAMRMGEIIDHMRIFSRKQADAITVFDPSLSVRQVVNMIEAQFLAEDVGVVVRYPNGRHGVRGRPVHLEQVLLNLLTNARDAICARQAMLIRAGVAEPLSGCINIDTAVDERNCLITITIQDNGGGIPQDNLDRIFEPFYTTKEVGTGTGLGLSVSFGLISAMSGSIRAENRDSGACFTISLPLTGLLEDDREGPVAAPAIAFPEPGPEVDEDEPSALLRHVLVVDDEPFATKLLADHLTNCGYRVSTASDGEDGYECFLEDPPDIVVSDLRMPRCDGGELMRRIHAHLPELPVVLVTGHLGLREEAGSKLQEEAAGLLKKPISLGELTGLIDRILDGNS